MGHPWLNSIVVKFTVLLSHPWIHACCMGVLHAYLFIVGSHYEDEQIMFTKKHLLKSDVYRDRLLTSEIGELVDLSDALQLTISQRKALFRCFLHLDYMRQGGISRSELLRYCHVRDTPITEVLLPSHGVLASDMSKHRSHEFRTQRWDVIQLISLCFSLCTLDMSSVCIKHQPV